MGSTPSKPSVWALYDGLGHHVLDVHELREPINTNYRFMVVVLEKNSNQVVFYLSKGTANQEYSLDHIEVGKVSQQQRGGSSLRQTKNRKPKKKRAHS